jgi:protocatechuate 3,4-dioxygenase beta subunit
LDPATLNCTLTPETTEGPYWVDERLRRTDVTEGQAGVPLKLVFGVYEADAASNPYAGAVVDIWQANALGLYSDQPLQPRENTGGQTFLRGCQIAGDDGAVEFRTIYPGWYEGRTLHIHVRVRTFAEAETIFTFTTQVFFAEETNDAVLATSPYDKRPERDTTNADDSIFLPELVAKTAGDPSQGLSAAFGIRLRGLPPLAARGEPGR